MADAAQDQIIPRNPDLSFGSDLPANWHSNDPAISHFYDGLSLTFPEGERFFVDSVRHFSDQITDPDLKKAVRGFAGQEAIHSKEHETYNAHLRELGLKPEKIERLLAIGLKLGRKMNPKTQLAVTCALEHYTAIFAEVILSDDAVMADAHPNFANIWRWHAMEESEHKAVAFDVLKTVDPGFLGYLRRVSVMTFVTLDFNFFTLVNQIYLMKQAGELWNLHSWGRSVKYLWGKPGVWRKVLGKVPTYYRPGFHPDDQDTTALLTKWRAWYDSGMSPTAS